MKKTINTIALILMIAINGAANIVQFNGVTTAQISDLFPVFIIPAGYVFTIWGLIYFLLGVFVMYQWVGVEEDDERFNFLTPLFVLSSIANVTWIFFWHYQIISGSLIMMIVLFLTLLAMYCYVQVKTNASSHVIEKWTLLLPLSVYVSWISIAALANVEAYLFFIGWQGPFQADQRSAVMLIVAGIFGIAFGFKFKDIAYNLVLMWAIVGIMLKFYSVPTVSYTSALVLVALLFVIVWILIVRKRD